MREECPEILPSITDNRDHVVYALRDVVDGCQTGFISIVNYIFDPIAAKVWFISHIIIAGKVIQMLSSSNSHSKVIYVTQQPK